MTSARISPASVVLWQWKEKLMADADQYTGNSRRLNVIRPMPDSSLSSHAMKRSSMKSQSA